MNDATQTPKSPEAQGPPKPANEQLTPEVQQAPSASEAAQSGAKADDGVATAQAQVAAVDPATVGQTQNAATPPPAQPQAAADQDVIEPEWVNKAKKIVEDYKEKPREEEDEVEKLQQEYMKQRYGVDVKSADSE